MKTTEYTKENPDLNGFDLDAMADLGAFHDGSGGGIRQIAWEMQKLRELQDRVNLLHAFARKYQQLLARLSWSLDDTVIHPTKKQGDEKDIGVFVPEIALCHYTYDKRKTEAKEIAALWPDAQWRRSMPRYSHREDSVRDYTTDIDGVLVRINDAEKLPKAKPVDRFGPCGPVRIPRVNDQGDGRREDAPPRQ
jgi:hypothetical protein